jgi:hypothetical protein
LREPKHKAAKSNESKIKFFQQQLSIILILTVLKKTLLGEGENDQKITIVGGNLEVVSVSNLLNRKEKLQKKN